MITSPLARRSEIELGLLPQRFQTSRRELLPSWRVQLATGLGEAGDGLVDESEVGGEGGMEGDAKEGDAVEGGGMEISNRLLALPPADQCVHISSSFPSTRC